MISHYCDAIKKAITIDREPIAVILDEGAELIKRHGAEMFCGPVYDGIEFDVDHEYYAEAEQLGMLYTYGVRDEEGVLIGYMTFMVLRCPRHKSIYQAVCDSIYLDDELRHSTFGKRMITYADDQLRELGVTIIYFSAPVHRMWGKILTRMGYDHTEELFARRV